MPEDKKEDTPFSELPPGRQLARAKAAKAAATDNLKAARSAKDKKKEEAARRAWGAANRVVNRLEGASSSKAGGKAGAVGGSTPAERRKPIERATGTDKTREALERVAELAKANKKNNNNK